MYFLSDIANFAQKDDKKENEKVGLVRKGLGFVVGKTPSGMLTRAAGLVTVGGGLYGASKLKNLGGNRVLSAARRDFMLQKTKKALTGDTAKNIGASAAGTVAGGIALNEANKYHQRKNRKWWEIL